MLSDLGIHELASRSNPTNPILLPPNESDLAYALLSACVVYEGVWTLYLGRPTSIPRSMMRIVALRCRAREPTDSPWLNAWVGLCVPMAEASHVLNEHSLGDAERNASLHKLLKDVEEWYEALPDELVYNEARLTNMNLAGYGLHTQYCKLQILLRQAMAKPSNPKKRRYSEITPDENVSEACPNSADIMYRYALRIARLVVTYREVFGMEKIPSIVLDNAVVAATVMIKQLGRRNSINHAEHEFIWLRQLLRSLQSVQPHFTIVRRMLESLQKICGDNLLAGMIPSPPRQELIDVSRELPPHSRQTQMTPDSNDFGNCPIPCDNELDNPWRYFDTVVGAAGGLPSIGVNDFFCNLPPAESLMSSLLQQVP